MVVKNYPNMMIGRTLSDADKHDWRDCLPVVENNRVIAVVSLYYYDVLAGSYPIGRLVYNETEDCLNVK